MPFEIQWTGPMGPESTRRKSAVDALRYAVQMFGRGYTDVVIVDLSEDGKAYSLADFRHDRQPLYQYPESSPGTVVANIQEGVLTLENDGRPTATYKAGDAVVAEAGKIHEDINNGTTPVKLIAVYVVEKGKPLTSPVP